jgi:hypothetical protein
MGIGANASADALCCHEVDWEQPRQQHESSSWLQRYRPAACLPRGPIIGTAGCAASFWVDGAEVSNHATILENSTIEAEGTAARAQIAGGVRLVVDLSFKSAGLPGPSVLERAACNWTAAGITGLRRGLSVSLLAKPGHERIVTAGASGEVEVAALAHVEKGVAVANVAAANAVDLRLVRQGAVRAEPDFIIHTGDRPFRRAVQRGGSRGKGGRARRNHCLPKGELG